MPIVGMDMALRLGMPLGFKIRPANLARLIHAFEEFHNIAPWVKRFSYLYFMLPINGNSFCVTHL